MLTLSLQKQNPIFLIFSQLQSPSSLAYNLCKWSALILSLLATVLIIRFRHNTPSIPLIMADYDYSDSDDDDDDAEISSEFEEEEDDDEEEERTHEYFRTRGSSSSNDDGAFIRCSIGDFLSLSEIANTKSVVKLWDSI